MSRCRQTLWADLDAPRCIREEHDGAHVYAASDAPDRHDTTEPHGDDQ